MSAAAPDRIIVAGKGARTLITLAAEQVFTEEACEKALQSGTDGVASVKHGDDTWIYVLPEVEYGTVNYFPTPEAFDEYLFQRDAKGTTSPRNEQP